MGPAWAIEIDRAEIEFHGKTYKYAFSSIVDAPHHAVMAVVTDYELLAKTNDGMKEAVVLEQYDAENFKRNLTINQCILLFCVDLVFVEQVRYEGDKILTTIVPEESSFEAGYANWEVIKTSAQQTRITIEASHTPKFWVPPVIGPFLIKRTFLREVRESSEKIEQLAQQQVQ